MTYRHLGKRSLDLAVALALSPFVLLLAALLGALVFLKLGRPVLYVQIRAGLNGTTFPMYKFRTMTNERDADGDLRSDSERITPVGKFLRYTSLDELPGFVNVLKGDVSLVGPRPLLVEYLPLYSSQQARRHEVKPGITGWAQVNGRNALSWEDKFKLDVWYVDHQSLLLDLQILLRTLKTVVRSEGISAAGEATMARFAGSAAESP